MAHPDPDFPFPFFGAGEASYYMWAEVHVRFARQPSTSQRAVIVDTVPVPLRGALDWCEGRQLMVASGLFLHGTVVRSYPVAPGESDRIGDDGWLYAAPSRIAALNADIERWLLLIHRECPILAAYRAEDPDSGGTRLSDWHELEPRPAAWPAARAGAPPRPGQPRHLHGPGHHGHGPARRKPAQAWRLRRRHDLLGG